tara:strand:- start:566 stop:784 length:219 start_codon:yes stop_codon:yes gene_type:complete
VIKNISLTIGTDDTIGARQLVVDYVAEGDVVRITASDFAGTKTYAIESAKDCYELGEFLIAVSGTMESLAGK